MADPTVSGTTQDIPVITPQEAMLRQNSGGYLANGQPAPPTALVDNQSSMKFQRGKGFVPNVEPQSPDRADDILDIEAKLTGAPSAPKQSPLATPLLPHQADIKNYTDLDKLRAAAKDAGIDIYKIPDEYWQTVSNRYTAAHTPDTLQQLKTFVNASGIGHFMQGVDSGAGDPDHPIYLQSPAMQEQMKADRFFNQNIQTRIVDTDDNGKAKYIDANGEYHPPQTYQAGKMLAGILSSPGANVAIPAAAKASATQALGGLQNAAKLTSAWVSTHPAAGALLDKLMTATVFGMAYKIFAGGSRPVVPPP